MDNLCLVLKISHQKVELEECQNENRVRGPGHGEEACKCPPDFFVGVARASPDRYEDPGCVGGEARQKNLPQDRATIIKCDDIKGDNDDAGGNPVSPKHFPEWFLAAPRPNLRSEKVGCESNYR